MLSKARDVLWRCLKGAAHQQRRTSLALSRQNVYICVYFLFPADSQKQRRALLFVLHAIYAGRWLCSDRWRVTKFIQQLSFVIKQKKKKMLLLLLIILYTFHLKNKLSTKRIKQ